MMYSLVGDLSVLSNSVMVWYDSMKYISLCQYFMYNLLKQLLRHILRSAMRPSYNVADKISKVTVTIIPV